MVYIHGQIHIAYCHCLPITTNIHKRELGNDTRPQYILGRREPKSMTPVGSFRGHQLWQLRGFPRRREATRGPAELYMCREHSLSAVGGLLSELGMWVKHQGANNIAKSRRGRPVGVR